VTDFDSYSRYVNANGRLAMVPHMVTMDDDRVVVMDAFLHACTTVAHFLAHALGACRLRESQRTG
jgi:hypothetical protein